MPVLVLSPRYTPDSNTLWKAAIEAGWSVERIYQYKPPAELIDQEIAFYGEALFVTAVAAVLKMALYETPLDWLTHLPDPYRQRKVRFMSLGAARLIPERAFIKPADDKSFDSKVYESGAQLPPIDILPDEIPVLVSEPVHWEIEFRCFVLNREVQTFSPYLRHDELVKNEEGLWLASEQETHEALTFAKTVLADQNVPFPPALVLDVGKIAGKGWAVIEANPAWGAGIYGCDPAKVLTVLAKACIKHSDVTSDDQAWLIERIER